MNVHLTPQQKKFVEERVRSRRYASPSEVNRAGLRLLEEDERWRAELRARIATGMAEAAVGQLIDGDEVLEGLLARIDSHRKKNA